MFAHISWSEFMLAAVALIAVYCIMVDLRRRQAKRTRDMETAAHFLALHYEHLEAFLKCGTGFEEFEQKLIDFSDALSNEKTCARLAARWNIEAPPEAKEDAKALARELSDLERQRPDLYRSFLMSVTSGTVAMLYRWPATASMRERLISEVAVDPAKEVAIAASTLKHKRDDNDAHMDGGLVPA
ncbi:MAG: hypothetical protein KIT25_01900 [Enhydrobacter sp.]|nr:MAG: hypothetical protein KIT25_01900 [Enhydrobacter sp.]